jgi:DNA-directed RNA polymerase specialized sigma24 family protein
VADDYDREVEEWKAIADGDKDAWGRWFTNDELGLRRSLRRFAAVVDVEKIVQDTAIKVFRHAERIVPDGKPGFLIRWAVTVARNQAKTEATRAGASRAGKLLSLDSEERLKEPEVRFGGGDPILRAQISKCHQGLQPAPRSFLARYLEDGGGRVDDLAARLGMTADAARQNLRRARQGIRECLQRVGIDVTGYLR